MARKLRVSYAGAIYHVTIRGIDRRIIFNDDADRDRFVTRLGEGVSEYGVRLYLYCLMSNHAHLVVETPKANLSAFMHKVQTAYSVYYNLRHGRTGHLMQGRFGAKPVSGNEYLLSLSRYVHLNPVVVAGWESRPAVERRDYLRVYAWSSYRGYAGLVKPWAWLEADPVLALTEAPERRRHAAYRRYVEAGLKSDKDFLEVLRDAQWGIGDATFQEEIRNAHADMTLQVRRREDVSFRMVMRNLDPERVLAAVARAFNEAPEDLRRRRRGCVARAAVALLLSRHAGMNQRDIGTWLGMGTGVSVSLQLKTLRNREAQDPALQHTIARVEKELEQDC